MNIATSSIEDTGSHSIEGSRSALVTDFIVRYQSGSESRLHYRSGALTEYQEVDAVSLLITRAAWAAFSVSYVVWTVQGPGHAVAFIDRRRISGTDFLSACIRSRCVSLARGVSC